MTIDIKTKEKFIKAEQLSNKKGVSAYHLLMSYIETDENVKNAVEDSVIFFEDFMIELQEKMENFKLNPKEERISNDVKALVASIQSNKLNDPYSFFNTLLNNPNIKAMLKESYATPSEVMDRINGKKDKDEKKELSPLSKERDFSSSISKKIIGTTKKSAKPLSENALINLNKKAELGLVTQIIGRNEEIQKIIQILQRKTKNSPILVGESGVGKSIIVENLARKIHKGDVPEFLKDKIIMELNTTELVSDTRLQGELESKFNELIEKIKSYDGKVILYIDNMHSISKSSNQANRNSIAELLKQPLARGDFSCISSTTGSEIKIIESDPSLERAFQKINIEQPTVPETISILRGLKSDFEKHYGVEIEDEALIRAAKLSDRYITDRCFPDKAIDLLDEAASIVKISIDSKPQKIVNLENKIAQKVLEKGSVPPSLTNDINEEIEFIDKEILQLNEELEECKRIFKEDLKILKREKDLKLKLKTLNGKELDSAKAELKTLMEMGFKILKTKVKETEIREVIAQKTGIPLDKINESDKEKVLKLESRLEDSLIGQPEAVKAVSSSIRRSQAGLSNPSQPSGSFLFLGSTGVGKTELCKQLAIVLFDSEQDMLRFDMSEFQEKHTVSQLIGSPIGYEGSNEGGRLTEAVKNKPYSIVLFDEIEKAHPDVLNLLLQILDDGRLSDSRGNLIDFKNTIIVLTSNIGSEHIKEKTMFNPDPKKKVIKELEKKMRPELINRIDEKIVFERLSEKDIAKIAKISLSKIKSILKDKKIELDFTDEAIEYLAKISNDSKYGARPLNRKIKNLVEDELATAILNNQIKKGDSVVFNLNYTGATITHK